MAVGIGLLIIVGHELELHLGDLEYWLQTLGIWAPLGFIGVFILLTPFWVSVDVLCFIAGLLFPLFLGEVYMIFATYLAAAVIFVLGRYLFKERVNQWLMHHSNIARLSVVLSRQASFKLMFLLRLTPLPFALLSYTFAVAPVRFWAYLAATTGVFIYNGMLVYLGYTTKHLAGYIAGQTLPVHVPYHLMAAGVFLGLIIILYVARIAIRKINELDKTLSSKLSSES